jgi:hypothetical protein
MSLPGFSAEASLYKSTRLYLGHSNGTSSVPDLVTPNARIELIGVGDIVDFIECVLWDCPGGFVPCVKVCWDIFIRGGPVNLP